MKKTGMASKKQDFQHALVWVLPDGWKEQVATWPHFWGLAPNVSLALCMPEGKGPPHCVALLQLACAESALGKSGVFLGSLGVCTDAGPRWGWKWE